MEKFKVSTQPVQRSLPMQMLLSQSKTDLLSYVFFGALIATTFLV